MAQRLANLGLTGALVFTMTASLPLSSAEANPTLQHIGEAIFGGAAGDEFGHALALNQDGSHIAVGSPQGLASPAAPGYARVFSDVDGSWQQRGTVPLVGSANSDLFGASVAVSSDGLTLAVGAPGNDAGATNAGEAQVFRFDEVSGEWAPLGAPLRGVASNQQFGAALALDSTGEILAVGARLATGVNAVMSGTVQVFQWDGNTWSPLGSRIDGAATGDYFGFSVSLSHDGQTIVVGAPGGDSAGVDAGVTQAFAYTGTDWEPKGITLEGAAMGEKSGSAVSLSAEGDYLVVGAPEYATGGAGATGLVRIFTWSDGAWLERGNPVVGAQPLDAFGRSVSISGDGQRFAVGGDSGTLSVFDFVDSDWALAAKTIESTESGGSVTVALASDGQRVALGQPGSGAVATNAGEVSVFEWPPEGVMFTTQDTAADRGVAGIHLHIAGPLGRFVAGSPVYFGASLVMPDSTLVVTLRPNIPEGNTVVLWSLGVDGRGDAQARYLLGDLAPGNYTVTCEGVHASGTGLRLTNQLSVSESGRISALGRNLPGIW